MLRKASGNSDSASSIRGAQCRDDLLGAHGDEESELAQQATQRVEPGGALCDPTRTQAVQRGEHLLGHALDRDGVDLLVAAGLQDALGVGTVGLVPTDIGSNVVGRKQDDVVAEGLNLPCPMM